MRLENSVAVVAGGGSGIGAAICRAFAQEGAHAAVTDLRQEADVEVAATIPIGRVRLALQSARFSVCTARPL